MDDPLKHFRYSRQNRYWSIVGKIVIGIPDSRYKDYNSSYSTEMELQEVRLESLSTSRSILTNGILTYERDINKVIKEFCTGILQAAKERIPKGARKDY